MTVGLGHVEEQTMEGCWGVLRRRTPVLRNVASICLFAMLTLASAAIPQGFSLKFCTGFTEPPSSSAQEGSGVQVELPDVPVAYSVPAWVDPNSAGQKFCGLLDTSGAKSVSKSLVIEDSLRVKSCGGTWSNNKCAGFPRNC